MNEIDVKNGLHTAKKIQRTKSQLVDCNFLVLFF